MDSDKKLKKILNWLESHGLSKEAEDLRGVMSSDKPLKSTSFDIKSSAERRLRILEILKKSNKLYRS